MRDMAGQRQEGMVTSGDGGVGHARGRGVRAREVGVHVPSGHLLPVLVSDGCVPDVHCKNNKAPVAIGLGLNVLDATREPAA